MLGPKCIGSNLVLGPIEGGIVLESVVKSVLTSFSFPMKSVSFVELACPDLGER